MTHRHSETHTLNGQYEFNFMLTEHPLVRMGVEKEAIAFLQSDVHWAVIQGNRAAIVDMDHDLALVVHPATFSIYYAAIDMNLSHEKGLGGIAVLLSHAQSQDNERGLLAQYVHPLGSGAPLLVIESGGNEANVDMRKRALQEAGFVHVGIAHHGDFLVWYANKRQTAHRAKTNIWESPKSSTVAQTNFEAMLADYKAADFVVLSTQSIEERLSASTFIPGDLALLRQGRDVLVQSPCGCFVHHTTGGEWFIQDPMVCNGDHIGLGDAIAHFESLTPVEPFFMGSKHDKDIEILTVRPEREEIIGPHEAGCGGILTRLNIELRTIVRHGQTFNRFQVDTQCSSCGYTPFEDKTYFIDLPVTA